MKMKNISLEITQDLCDKLQLLKEGAFHKMNDEEIIRRLIVLGMNVQKKGGRLPDEAGRSRRPPSARSK